MWVGIVAGRGKATLLMTGGWSRMPQGTHPCSRYALRAVTAPPDLPTGLICDPRDKDCVQTRILPQILSSPVPRVGQSPIAPCSPPSARDTQSTSALETPSPALLRCWEPPLCPAPHSNPDPGQIPHGSQGWAGRCLHPQRKGEGIGREASACPRTSCQGQDHHGCKGHLFLKLQLQ